MPAGASFSAAGSPQTFGVTVEIDLGNTVERVVLIRPGSVTHQFDPSQRYIEQAFTVDSVSTDIPPTVELWTLTVTAPNEQLGPPGYYMLFAVEKRNSDGELVPSVGEFIQIL